MTRKGLSDEIFLLHCRPTGCSAVSCVIVSCWCTVVRALVICSKEFTLSSTFDAVYEHHCQRISDLQGFMNAMSRG